jgi:Bacterial Ig-like domain
MNTVATRSTLAATLLAACLALAACGGGSASPPPGAADDGGTPTGSGDGGGAIADVTPPFVTITDNIADGVKASGDVTFTFTFSEPVGTSFSAASIIVTGGTKGAFTMVSPTSATLVVSPKLDAVGSIVVAVGSGKFFDTANNLNATGATASQAYDTDTPPTLTITDDVAAEVANGPVTFSFHFSKDIGTSFTAADISASGGSVGTFTRVNGSTATLRMLPPANGTGTLSVSVAAGSVIDLAGHANTVGASARQAYLTDADVTPPTLAITDNVLADPATGVVTFSFAFSEDVGNSFTAGDITVTGGSAGTLSRVDATAYRLAVTPPANATGVLSVNVAAGRFSDVSGNVSTAAVSASQSFDTRVTSGDTGTCTAAPCLDFAGANVGYLPFEGLVSAAQSADPVNALNKVAKFVKGPAGQPWAGATIYTSATDNSVAAVGLSTSKLVTLRVYAEAAGQTMRMKIESATDPLASLEAEALTTQAGAWETLSFDFSALVAGSYDPCKTYNKISVFPQFSITAPPATDTTTYFDELKYAADTGGGDDGSCGVGLIDLVGGKFASSYAAAGNAWVSAEGGDAITYIDDSVPTQFWWGGVAPASDTTPANYYFGYGINIANKPWGFAAAVKAPTNGAARVVQYGSFHIEVWGNNELMSTLPTLTVLMVGKKINDCAAVLQGSFQVTGTGPRAYTVPMSSLVLQTPCAFATPTAALTAGVAEIQIQVLDNNVQYTTPADGNGNYANGLNIGPMTFLDSGMVRTRRPSPHKTVLPRPHLRGSD